jgi:broad specificity phosphatase PhoE
MLNRRRFGQTTAIGLAAFPAVLLAQPAGFWTLLREGGCVLLMRHAQTEPGVGDPPNFEIGNCSTQRNLSNAGREQARKVHKAFVRERVKVDQVRSSAWCRCVDTAMLAFKQNTVWAPINSFFGTDTRDAQTREVLNAVQGWQAPRNLALVTHQVNIVALTGQSLAMGEILLTRPSRDGSGTQLRVVARQGF